MKLSHHFFLSCFSKSDKLDFISDVCSLSFRLLDIRCHAKEIDLLGHNWEEVYGFYAKLVPGTCKERSGGQCNHGLCTEALIYIPSSKLSVCSCFCLEIVQDIAQDRWMCLVRYSSSQSIQSGRQIGISPVLSLIPLTGGFFLPTLPLLTKWRKKLILKKIHQGI